MSELLQGSIWLAAAFLLGIADELLRARRCRVEGWGKGRDAGIAGTVQAGSNHGRPFPELSTRGGGGENSETKGAANGPGLRDGVGARPIAPRWWA